MNFYSFDKLAAAALSLVLSHGAFGGELSVDQKKELIVFGLRAMGLQAGTGDVKKVLSRPEIDILVATGINLNGHLCAQVTAIRALDVKSAYEVSCIAMRGGSAKKAYVLEALKGTASSM